MAISKNKYEKLLGFHIDNKLTFEPYVRSLCKKASQKLNDFARIAFSLKCYQTKILLNAFITSHFSYALVAWIFQEKLKLIMNESFDIIESPYPLRNALRFKSRNICAVRYGIETGAFVGSRIWSYMPSELKKSMSLNVFMSKIKTWRPENCPCKLCKIYLQ